MMTTVGFAQSNSFLVSFKSESMEKTKALRAKRVTCSSSSFSHIPLSSSSNEAFHRTEYGQAIGKDVESEGSRKKKRRVFFLDVSPLCYEGNKPSSKAFGHWLSLFFSQVSLTDPVIAVHHSSPQHKSFPFLFFFPIHESFCFLFCRFLMEKKVTSDAESYCLLIKRIGKHPILENTPKGHTNSSNKFSRNAMCQWVKLCFYSVNPN